jgi:chitinase
MGGGRLPIGILVGAFAVGCGSQSADHVTEAGSTAGQDGSPTADSSADAANDGRPGDGTGSVSTADAGRDVGTTSAPDGGTASDGSPAADAGEGGSPEAASPPGLWVMGYYSSWDANTYPIAQIDWGGLTHIATAFNLPDGNGGVSASGSFDPALAKSVVSAAHAAGKKAIASIGGSGSASVFEGSTSSANLATFVGNLQNLVTTIGDDGVDIDWEGGPSSDQALLLSLVKALRAAIPGALITVPVGIQNNNSPGDLSSFGNLAPLVDQINLMSYGMSGAWSGWKSWHSSPLHWNQDTATPVGIDSSVADYLAASVPASKLGVGSGFYGECYSSPVTAPDQALGGSQVVSSDGVMSYAHIMSAYYSAGARQWDAVANVPYLTFATAHGAEGCTYVTYEDAQSIAAKAAWVKSKGLGGVIIWTINEGYLASAPAGQQSPLLEAMKAGFLQ